LAGRKRLATGEGREKEKKEKKEREERTRRKNEKKEREERCGHVATKEGQWPLRKILLAKKAAVI
jgi:hypothetical protein